MAVTENTYTGNGSTTSYSLTFQYIDEDDIKVSLNGTDTTAYTLANATTVLFNTAPANGVAIRIYRRTNTDNLKATFFAGSAIRAQDLNDDFLQNNYAVQEIQNNTWDKETQTIHSDETWVSSDTQIATTAAMDARFQDEAAETITSAEGWPDNDDTIATTAAIDNRIDSKIDAAITGDIATDGTGITVTNDGDGTITLGLGANSIDFDRIKDVDIITQAEQNAGSPSPADTNLFTASAAARRFDTIVQTTTPTGSNWEVGKTWLQNDANLTLSVWNGSAWLGLASGGTFTNQPKVVYVDASAGSDNNDGHRISRPKATIKAAIQQINNDASYGDGSIVVVAPGVYQEVAPIDIQKSNVSIIGTALRSCIVHPTPATETNVLFRVNSGSYLQNLTFTGMKASGALGNTVDAALPVNQGWNVSFYPGATIIKSPYIQNCTNFSDSEIDNSNLNVITPAGGAAGDTDSAPTGGGLLVDGSVVNSASPLRSMVCDSYTHVGLNGPGILVTNNGYAQCTSSYAFFNKYHIKCLNGGQANLAASTTDFGDQALVADGKSTAAIFTAALSTSVSSGATTFTINAPTAGASWHGSATRPQGNMLVVLNGITYPILSATANGSGWNVTISRPNPTNRSENLGLNGAVSTPATASFYLRSMIASSGHTMEYVGSGTNYLALPENGGVPDNTKQIVELNNGKVWTAITDQNGKFKVGDFFEVDQQLGFVTIPSGSIAFDLASDLSPQLGANLDVLSRTISSSTGNVRIDDTLEVNAGTAAAPAVTFNGDTNTGLYSPGADQVAISTNGTGRLFVSSTGQIGIGGAPSGSILNIIDPVPIIRLTDSDTSGYSHVLQSDTSLYLDADRGAAGTGALIVRTNGTNERLRITSDGKVGVGTSSPWSTFTVGSGGTANPAADASIHNVSVNQYRLKLTSSAFNSNTSWLGLGFGYSDNYLKAGILAEAKDGNARANLHFCLNNSTTNANASLSDSRMVITYGGNVGIGTTNPTSALHIDVASGEPLRFRSQNSGSNYFTHVNHAGGDLAYVGAGGGAALGSGTTSDYAIRANQGALLFGTNGNNERARIDSSGRLLVGTSSARSNFFNTTLSSRLQVEGANHNDASVSIVRNENGATPWLVFGSTRGTTVGSTTVLQNGDGCGGIAFLGSDGTEFVDAARIVCEVDGTPGANDMPGRLVFQTTADGAASPTERMRINSLGRVLLNNAIGQDPWLATGSVDAGAYFGAGDNFGLAVNSRSIPLLVNRTNTTGTIQEFKYNGSITGYITTSASAITITYSSDYRLKENVIPLTNAVSRIKQLQPKRFNYIVEPEITVDGFLAHEAQNVVPEAVVGTYNQVNDNGDPVYQGIDPSKMVPLLTAALQEAIAKIESLEARLTAAGI